MPITRRQLLTSAAALPLAGLSLPTWAQSAWPSRTVRIVVPYPPGGSSDIIGRIISQALSEALKQTVVVENKPGANGNLGAAFVVQSNDGGHSLLLCDIGALAISPSVYTKLTFDPSTDMQPVSMLAYSPHVLAVHPSVPANNLQELIALTKKQRINFAVPAVGSAPHLAAVEVQQATGAQWEYVPYKGGAQALTDAVGGQTEAIMNGLLATLPHIRSGKLRAIGLSKAERMSLVPDIPTIAEQGVPGFESGTWQGIMAPKELSAESAKSLSDKLTAIVNQPEIRAKLNEQGAEIVTMDPAKLKTFFEDERKRWAKLVASANIRLD